MLKRVEEILDFWFEGLNDAKTIDKNALSVRKWFIKDEKFDNQIRERFGNDIDKARAGEYKEWKNTPQGCLALIILFDQFSRNIYRNTPKAFETDLLALDFTLRLIKERKGAGFSLIERIFLYMPLMHAEDLKVQEMSLKYFGKLCEESKSKSPQNTSYYLNSFDFAKRHHAIIQQFGRFPHRNAILNRASTQKEEDFLKKPGSRF